MIFWENKKFLKPDDLLLLFLKKKKKLFFILHVTHNNPFFVQIGPKQATIFFQNYWIPTQVININWIP